MRIRASWRGYSDCQLQAQFGGESPGAVSEDEPARCCAPPGIFGRCLPPFRAASIRRAAADRVRRVPRTGRKATAIGTV